MSQQQTIKNNVNQKIRQSLKDQKPICGDCEGFECEVLRGTKICKEQDQLFTSEVCSSYSPSIRNLRTEEDDGERDMKNILDLARLVAELPDSKLRPLGALISGEVQTRKSGFNMGQKVYVRYRGRANVNYLSNFMSAYIMYAKRNTIRIMSKDGKICMTLENIATKTVYTHEEFLKMRKQMLKKGRFADPEVHQSLKRTLRCVEEYELGLYDANAKESVPTIDTVFKSNKIRKSTRTGDTDLVAIVKAIENLHDAKTIDVPKRKRRKSKRVKSYTQNGTTVIEV